MVPSRCRFAGVRRNKLEEFPTVHSDFYVFPSRPPTLEQFALHLGCMVYAVALSKRYLDDDYEPDLDGEFKPNVINSVVFLVRAVQQVSGNTVLQYSNTV